VQKAAAIIIAKDGESLSTKGTGKVTMKSL